MKSLSKLALCLLLAMSLTVSAFAAQVPDSLVAENLNGQQRLVKTYTLSPEVDPDELKEEDFSYDGYLYTWAYTTKVEHPYLESKTVTETVTVNTAKMTLRRSSQSFRPVCPMKRRLLRRIGAGSYHAFHRGVRLHHQIQQNHRDEGDR